ncbi:50S ribosomal protein L23 [Enterobacteriaceae endosymbiont of Neohaemonia nigricornis]|uniref:50S ribosomal protein L23 n=1 Tax=Enterobacteriaceae endosymbiont of Neohaemonia nigricornis TaxID=2675792 RepID=UPI00144922D9|nr:50S ribosomal protein L23 [Enterobacteriaceae endosymbiont of Neohaemonia nigricornis]QJC30468.1 50S ribosomal protein L23 [Enterobacteriaceae endosymbiont of Neohaemonia nigricornis]
MIKENYFKILKFPHMSEKSSIMKEKNNIIVIKILKTATKKEIFISLTKIFNVKIKNINTLIIKGKYKKNKNNHYYESNWKKAYITLEKKYNIDFNININ